MSSFILLAMWRACLFVLGGCSAASAQSSDWDAARLEYRPFPAARVAPSQKRQVERFLARHLAADSDECLRTPGSAPPAFEQASLGSPFIVLVKTRGACGGNVNKPAWLVDLRSGSPRLLADVYGGFLVVQTATHLGLRDFLVGWHMSAFETGFTRFRYDGRRYQAAEQATAYSHEDPGPERMAQRRKECQARHEECTLIWYKQPD